MIRPTRPSASTVERYRADRIAAEPTFVADPGSADRPPPGFHLTEVSVDLGRDPRVVDEARSAFRSWQVHRRSGVEPTPADVAPAVGATVALVTRQAGLWILAACRITDVLDEPDACGFTYATLPDHPECGEERFAVTARPDGTVRFDIAATWRSDAMLARVATPLSVVLQRRATGRYLTEMVRSCPSAEQRFPAG